jgi:hypothetical protein
MAVVNISKQAAKGVFRHDGRGLLNDISFGVNENPAL